VRNRLRTEESYINGHRFRPHCASNGDLATVCRCEDGHSFFNCTTDSNQEKIKIFRTTGTESCTSDAFSHSRKKRAADVDQKVEDDYIILSDDFQLPPNSVITEPLPPPPTWPTPSGITEQQARDECQRVLENYAAYNICREYVDLESVITPCATNIQVCNDETLPSGFSP